ncbi:protein fantom isoform X2 [Alosa pseudoharengus]|uniref:protein fantom isoform X2 n=1 Tax=Alosa pseudoharengus TaxID=34774 RepID=UPI003F89D9F8
MSLAMDETAGDLPVRDIGLRGGVMAVMQDSSRDMRQLRRPQVFKIKASDRQRIFSVPREQLEDQCLRLQEENTLLKQHTRAQELKLRRLSTQLLRLREGRPGTAVGRDRETEDAIQELEARVATLESQKTLLQNKLSMARQHILDMGGRGPSRLHKGGLIGEGEVLHPGQTSYRNKLTLLEESRGDTERLKSNMLETQQARASKMEQAPQPLKDTEESMKEIKKQQADGHRLTIRENVDFIRLQKQLSDKSAALLLIQEKFNMLQETYEGHLREGEKALRESQETLLEKVEELNIQLKEETQRRLTLENQLANASMSLQSQEELKERVSYLEEERNILKQSYNTLVESTLSTQGQKERSLEKESTTEKVGLVVWKQDTQGLDETFSADTQDKDMLREEKEKMRLEIRKLDEERKHERVLVEALREKHSRLENEILMHRKEVTILQERLDSVTHVFDMSVEDLSEILLQIKAFRLQQESQEGTHILGSKGKGVDQSRDMASLHASYAETVFELHKTRDLLLVQHRISNDLQTELNMVIHKADTEKQQLQKKVAEKERMLKNRMRQIITLQEYMWLEKDQENVFPVEEDNAVFQLRRGESLLEVHLRGATFTPLGLRLMGQTQSKERKVLTEVTTFCTYALLDFETHSTPLVTGVQPNYGFTSRYALSPSDLARLAALGGIVMTDLHQKLGGVRFVTCGRAQISLLDAMEHRGEQLSGTTNITGKDGAILGVLEFWVRLYPPTGTRKAGLERAAARQLEELTGPRMTQQPQDWREHVHESQELGKHDTGTSNELEVVLDRCTGLRARWPEQPPDAYLTYQLYDLPPHSSPVIHCTSDPVFEDVSNYQMTVTSDVCEYLCCSKLWVYLYDDHEDQMPPAYLAKTSISLQALATGRPIKGDYTLRDSAGDTRGIVRVSLRWKYPFQPVKAMQYHRERDQPEREMPKIKKRELVDKGRDATVRPIAKPRLKEASKVQKKEEQQDDESSKDEVSEASESDKSRSSSSSDVIIIPPSLKPRRKGDTVRVEILSLSFDPNSRVAMDQSVQRVYVEYRLLGIPMETTETPLSLRKPVDGEEIHYHFLRVIYVDSVDSAPLRHYLYTMLEGTDPNKGRLKFTVVSEPLNEQEECVDVGYAYLDLKELLLTGNDITEKPIDILSMSEDEEVMGQLKVSLEAATALSGIYQEYFKREGDESEEL